MIGFAIALAIGLFIGLDRERSNGVGPKRGPAGLRTFAMASLAGATAMALGGPALVALVVAVTAAFAGIAYWRAINVDPGLTTEIALALTPVLGALAMVDRLPAAAIGVVVAVLLATKAPLHRFARDTLTNEEVGDGLVLAIVAVIVWPLLPDTGFGPGGVVNPHTLGLVAVLVLVIGAAGHIAVRVLGPRYGLAVSGLASGFVSSVATIGAMGSRARAEPAALPAAVAGAILSSLATFIQMAILLAAVSLPTLSAVAPNLAAGGGVILACGGLAGWRAAHTGSMTGPVGNAFSLKSALLMVAGLVGILWLTATVQPMFGNAGLVAGAALGGIVDTHAAAMSVAAVVAAGRLPADAAIIPILAAMSANAAMKILMAFTTGGRMFGLYIAGGVGASMIAAWTTLLIWRA